MSTTPNSRPPNKDAQKLCLALRAVAKAHGYSGPELAAATGLPVSSIGRWLRGETEPVPSVIAAIEDGMGAKRGTIYRTAELVVDPRSLVEMLATDSRLSPAFQRQAVETYRLWVRLSAE